MTPADGHLMRLTGRLRYARDGQAIAVAVLAIVPLVALILLVLCTGDAVNRKIKTQNVADVAAKAASAQASRALNLTSANNVEMARLLAAIVTLDDMERMLENTHNQLTAFSEAVDLQQRVSLPASDLNSATMAGIVNIETELKRELVAVSDYLSVMSSLDMHRHTTWDTSDSPVKPDGVFWRSFVDLGHINSATTESWGELVQGAAISAAAANGGNAVVFPFDPPCPLTDGYWSDWHRLEYSSDDVGAYRDSLLVYGWPPDLEFMFEDSDYSHTLAGTELAYRPGPFWRLFDWRRPSESVAGFLYGNVVSATGGVRGSFQRQHSSEAVKWRPYGPVVWASDRLYNSWMQDLYYGLCYYFPQNRRRDSIINGLQQAKLEYMFDQDRWGNGDSIELHWPQWYGYMEEVKALIDDKTDDTEIYQSVYFIMEYIGPENPESPNIDDYLRDSQYSNFYDADWQPFYRGEHSDIYRLRFGCDVNVDFISKPAMGVNSGTYSDYGLVDGLEIRISVPMSSSYDNIADYILHVQFSPDDFLDAVDGYAATSGPDVVLSYLGLEDTFSSDFEVRFTLLTEPSWYVRREIFAGADFGTDQPVHNPANFTDKEAEELPAPALLDQWGFASDYPGEYFLSDDSDNGFRHRYLNYTALSWSSSDSAAWRDRLGSANAAGVNLSLARSEVFNTASFDAWTQKWKSQLIPVGRASGEISEWEIDSGLFGSLQGELNAASEINIDSLENALEHIQRISNDSSAFENIMRH